MRSVVFFLSVLLVPLTFAQGDCLSLAKTELEKIYCQIAATPEAGNLPHFSDFRRNNAQIQTLLLKSPARRLGISLPTVKKPVVAIESKSNAKLSARTKKTTRKTASSQKAILPPSLVSQEKSTPQIVRDSLASCQLLKETVQCPGFRYGLVHNRQNQQLNQGVLGQSNVLELTPFRGNLRDKRAVNHYLAESYSHYIDKMLLIGLAGSTMTYTKFHYTFWELMEKRENFATRVGAMYEYLKKDKASMAVKTRYGLALPEDIDWCMELSDQVVVCDNGKKNWVYTRTE